MHGISYLIKIQTKEKINVYLERSLDTLFVSVQDALESIYKSEIKQVDVEKLKMPLDKK